MGKNILILALAVCLAGCLTYIFLANSEPQPLTSTPTESHEYSIEYSVDQAYENNPSIFIAASYEAKRIKLDDGFKNIKIKVKVSNNTKYVAQQVLVDVYVWRFPEVLMSLDHLSFNNVPADTTIIKTLPNKTQGSSILAVITSTRIDAIKLLKVTPYNPSN
jgi:hypothetical protein